MDEMDSKEVENKTEEIRNIPKIKYDTNQQFLDQIKSLAFLKNPLIDLAGASSATVYYGSPCCALRCCVPLNCLKCVCSCEDNYRYTTLINNGGIESKFLFRNWVTLNCNIFALNKLSRYKTCKSYTYSSYEDLTNDAGTEFCEMLKESCCSLYGLCSVIFKVYIPSEQNRIAGMVKYIGYCEECCSFKNRS